MHKHKLSHCKLSDHVSRGNVHDRLLIHEDVIAAKMTEDNDAVM